MRPLLPGALDEPTPPLVPAMLAADVTPRRQRPLPDRWASAHFQTSTWASRPHWTPINTATNTALNAIKVGTFPWPS